MTITKTHISSCVVLLLAVIGFGRVYHDAFTVTPFEHPDEIFHYDTVIRYAHGLHVGRPDPLTAEATPYYSPGLARTDGVVPLNQEVVEPPIYYTLAALWYHMGRLFDAPVPQWNRLLAGVFASCVVVVGFLVARTVFPQSGDVRPFLVAGVIAFFPSSDLCSVSNDSLSPLVFGLMLLAVASFRKSPAKLTAFIIGVTACAMLLTKTTLLPLVVVGVFSAGWAMRRWQMIVSFLVGFLPYSGWLVRNWLVLGELTGVNTKFAVFGFRKLPISEWTWGKFTPTNLWLFWHELADSFVFGEYPGTKWDDNDGLFGIGVFTIALIVPTIVLIRTRTTPASVINRPLLLTSIASVVAAIVFLAVSSVAFNFDSNVGLPTGWMRSTILSNGRLMSGAIIPFAVCLVSPLPSALAKRRSSRHSPGN
jgi:hypothetical protein